MKKIKIELTENKSLVISSHCLPDSEIKALRLDVLDYSGDCCFTIKRVYCLSMESTLRNIKSIKREFNHGYNN